MSHSRRTRRTTKRGFPTRILALFMFGILVFSLGAFGQSLGLPNLAGTTLGTTLTVSPTAVNQNCASLSNCPTVSGTGYTINAYVYVYLQQGSGNPNVIASPKSDITGSWTITVGLSPTQPLGTYNVWAVDQTTNQKSSTQSFSVIQASQQATQATTSTVQTTSGTSTSSSFSSLVTSPSSSSIVSTTSTVSSSSTVQTTTLIQTTSLQTSTTITTMNGTSQTTFISTTASPATVTTVITQTIDPPTPNSFNGTSIILMGLGTILMTLGGIQTFTLRRK